MFKPNLILRANRRLTLALIASCAFSVNSAQVNLAVNNSQADAVQVNAAQVNAPQDNAPQDNAPQDNAPQGNTPEANAVQNNDTKVRGAKTSIEKNTISNDFLLPVTANSKKQSLDGKKMTSIFIDNVVIRQGSLEILADRVVADATAGKGKEIITATGSPASYQQRLEDGSIVTASANEIQYIVASQTISLKGNAAIKQKDVQVNGDSIAFDMGKEQIMASTDANSDATVTTVLSPGAFSPKTDKSTNEVIKEQP